MHRASRITAAVALTGALALVAGPALANGSGQFVDTPPWQWYVAAGSGEWGISDTWYDDGEAAGSDAWDASELVVLGPSYVEVTDTSEGLTPAVSADFATVACSTSTLTVAGSDFVVSCNEASTTAWGLEITSEVRVLAPGDLARMTYLVTNTTDEALDFGYRYLWEYGDSSGHVRSTEPTIVQDTAVNGGVLDSPDVWSYNIGNGTLNAGVAWGIGGQPFTAADSGHNGYTEAYVELLPSAGRTIAPGETIALAFFHKVQVPEVVVILPPEEVSAESADAPTSALEAANTPTDTASQFMTEFATFTGRLTRGLPTGVTVGNWQPAAVPELADTGAGVDESLLMAGLAASLLGAGAALLIGRRAVRATRR